MPFYQRLGQVPHKRHTQFRRPDGALYSEHLTGTLGFSGVSALLYHHNPPTAASRVEKYADATVKYQEYGPLRNRHFITTDWKPAGDPVSGRRVILGNSDCTIGFVRPVEQMHYFYRNSMADELLFVHEGSGKLESPYGVIDYRPGDYLVIPLATTYRLVPNEGDATRMLVLESFGPIQTPSRYRNEFGQLLEHSPFCERDIRPPQRLETHIESGEFEIRVKQRGEITSFFYDFHPFDVVGWDGYLYPFALNIEDFEPIVGRIHQPPPVHQTFQGKNLVVCSFVPRLYDFHPQAVPVSYVHSNVNTDEVLYYIGGNYMSRKGTVDGSITLHPTGLPHGPQPGVTEASLGKTEAKELAVMIDTFQPLQVAETVEQIEDPKYQASWRI